jgi:hypothetical protein
MGKRIIYKYYLQGEIEKWNDRIERVVGEDRFEEVRDFILDGVITDTEQSLDQLELAGEASDRFTIEILDFDKKSK